MQIFAYESCKYTFSHSVLDNMESRRMSYNAGTFLYIASTCLLCIFACWADSMWVTVAAGVVRLCYSRKEHIWHPEALVNTLSSDIKHVGNLQMWNEMHLSMKVKMPGVRITTGKGMKELGWTVHKMITVSHSLWCHSTFNHFAVFHKVLVHHSTTVMWNGDS